MYENGRKLKVAEKGMLKGYKRAPPMVSLPEQLRINAHLGSHAGAFMASPRMECSVGTDLSAFLRQAARKGTQISNPAYSSEQTFIGRKEAVNTIICWLRRTVPVNQQWVPCPCCQHQRLSWKRQLTWSTPKIHFAFTKLRQTWKRTSLDGTGAWLHFKRAPMQIFDHI